MGCWDLVGTGPFPYRLVDKTLNQYLNTLVIILITLRARQRYFEGHMFSLQVYNAYLLPMVDPYQMSCGFVVMVLNYALRSYSSYSVTV